MKPILLNLIGNQLIRKIDRVDLPFNSKICVGIGVTALVYKNYECLNTFREGTYILNPSQKSQKLYVDDSVYHFYLTYLDHLYDGNWGVTPIDSQDDLIGTNISVSSIGSYKFCINALTKFINTFDTNERIIDTERIRLMINELLTPIVRDFIAHKVSESGYFELNKSYTELADCVIRHINDKLSHYGLIIKELMFNNFSILQDWILEELRKLNYAKRENDTLSSFKTLEVRS